MTGYDVVAEARLEFDDEEMSPQAGREELQRALDSGEIRPEITIEWHDEEE